MPELEVVIKSVPEIRTVATRVTSDPADAAAFDPLWKEARERVAAFAADHGLEATGPAVLAGPVAGPVAGRVEVGAGHAQTSTVVRSAPTTTSPSNPARASASHSASVPGAGAGTRWVSTSVVTPPLAAVAAASSMAEW